ncbi:MAG: hypothetical protein ACOWWR_19295 [Eubacteriales bacterium]
MSRQNPILLKGNMVNVAGRWGEGDYSYAGRPDLAWSEVSRGCNSWLISVKGQM